MQLSLDLVGQRWQSRRASYRPLLEPIDTTRFHVDLITNARARDFVLAHHYAGSFVVAIASYGLFERIGPHQADLVGVAVFSMPVQPKAANSYGAAGERFCDLGRFVLLDRVGGNAETYFLTQALQRLQADKRGEDGGPLYPLVLAYSDPMPRVDAAGAVQFVGHYGGIYRKRSALYLGRATARTLIVARDGSVISSRGLSKLRNDDDGARGAYERLVAHGAPTIAAGETGRDYLARALDCGAFRRVNHRGNHVYAFMPCGLAARRIIRNRMDRQLPYPTRTDLPLINPASSRHQLAA